MSIEYGSMKEAFKGLLCVQSTQGGMEMRYYGSNIDDSRVDNSKLENRQLFQEGSFKEAYQKAYHCIRPRNGFVDRIAERLEEEHAAPRALAAAGCAAVVLTVTVLPVMAKDIPAVYNIIERYAPALADFVLPVETLDTSAGITMQVEAVNVEGQNAEIIVSFSDAEDSTEDLIHGRVDLYDSYHLRSYGAESNVGGCSFLEYDEAEDKAYFKIDVTSFDTFRKGKLQFSVRQLLTNQVNEKKQIDISNLVENPALKSVALNGCSGMPGTAFYEEYIERGQREGQVMDLQKADASMAETITITGVGYENNILRLQFCRGNFSEADRHMWVSLVDESGEERSADFSVMWQEEVNGERFLFDENWFIVEESELEQLKMFGEYHITDGSVQGNWEVTMKLE